MEEVNEKAEIDIEQMRAEIALLQAKNAILRDQDEMYSVQNNGLKTQITNLSDKESEILEDIEY